MSRPPLLLAAAPLAQPIATPATLPTTRATTVPAVITTTVPSTKPNGQPTSVATTVATTVPTTVPTTVAAPAPIRIPVPTAFVTKWGLEIALQQTCAADLSDALAVHASLIRVQFLPDLQPKKCFDAMYAAASRARLKIIWITPAVNLNAPVDDAAYAQTMADAAAAYRGGIWEIMNEPDLAHPDLRNDWPDEQLAVNEYVILAQATASAIHTADPTAIVLSGGPSGIEVSSRALPWLHATANLAPLIDGVGFHPYVGFDAAEFQTVSNLYKKPIYVTEWQTSNGGTIESVLEDFNGIVPVFNYCAQACAASSAIPIFPQTP